MTHLSTFVLVAAMHAIPCEYVIDFGAEAAPFAYEMRLTVEARDRSRNKDMIFDFTEDTDPAANRDFAAYALKVHNWATRKGPGNSVVVTGRLDGKKSPIKSVTITSEKVIPVTVRWVPLVPEKK